MNSVVNECYCTAGTGFIAMPLVGCGACRVCVCLFVCVSVCVRAPIITLMLPLYLYQILVNYIIYIDVRYNCYTHETYFKNFQCVPLKPANSSDAAYYSQKQKMFSYDVSRDIITGDCRLLTPKLRGRQFIQPLVYFSYFRLACIKWRALLDQIVIVT